MALSVRVVPAHVAAFSESAPTSAAISATTNPRSIARTPATVAPERTQPPAETSAEIATTVQVTTTTDGGVEYVPRALLTEVPIPTRPLSIPYPRDGSAEGTFTTVLALFINEQGEVVRVRLDGAALPPELDTAAREAFRSARWRPGRMDGRLVKSLIRVEIMFQSGNAMQTIRSVD